MDSLVEKVLATYQGDVDLDEARSKIRSYFQVLRSARKLDEGDLIAYGLAYLKELHEGPDPQYSGL
jgi:hypothetical protein